MYDPTNIVDELNRKTFDALLSVVQKRRDDLIDDLAYTTAIQAIWDVTAGLTGEKVSAAVDEALNALDNRANYKRIVYSDSVNTFVFEWPIGSSSIFCIDSNRNSKTFNFSSPKEAVEKLRQIKNNAMDRGILLVGDEL